jgi:hypothetical protein
MLNNTFEHLCVLLLFSWRFMCFSREILSVNLWLALLLEQCARTRRGRALLHGVIIAS